MPPSGSATVSAFFLRFSSFAPPPAKAPHALWNATSPLLHARGELDPPNYCRISLIINYCLLIANSLIYLHASAFIYTPPAQLLIKSYHAHIIALPGNPFAFGVPPLNKKQHIGHAHHPVYHKTRLIDVCNYFVVCPKRTLFHFPPPRAF